MKKFNKQKYMKNEIANGYLIILVFLMVFIPDPVFMTTVVSVTTGFVFVWIREIQFNKNFKNPLNEVHRKLARRYLKLFETGDLAFEIAANQSGTMNEASRIKGMLLKLDGEADNWPTDKTSRWLGYCQRYLIEKKVTTVQEERNFSRSLFHRAYMELGYDIPESVDINVKQT